MIPKFESPSHTARIANRLIHGPRGKFQPGLLGRWRGKDLYGDLLGQAEFAKHARRLLRMSVSENVVLSSFASQFGGPITPERLEFCCWRVAANRDLLMSNTPVLAWRGLIRELHAPVQIIHAKPGQSPIGRLGTILTFRVIDGPACPARFERWFPNRYLWVMARELGLIRPRARVRRYFGKAAQLVGMRLVPQLKSRYRRRDEPSLDLSFDLWSGEQFRDYNRRLARERAKPCPLKYRWACQVCTLGLDYCPASRSGSLQRACRPVSLVELGCLHCRQDTWHDDGQCCKCREEYPPTVQPVDSWELVG